MVRDNEIIKEAVHQQLENILDCLFRSLYSGEAESNTKIEVFLNECESSLTSAISNGKPVQLDTTFNLCRTKFEVVKSILLIRHTRLIMNDFPNVDAYLLFKDDLISRLSSTLLQSDFADNKQEQA